MMPWSGWIQSPDYLAYSEEVVPDYMPAITYVADILKWYSSGPDTLGHPSFPPSATPIATGAIVVALHALATNGEGYDPAGYFYSHTAVMNAGHEVRTGAYAIAQYDGASYFAYTGIDKISQTASSYQVPSDVGVVWPVVRDWAPAILGTLTEGSDYGYIPNTTDYVQYESENDNVHTGWADWDVQHNVFAQTRRLIGFESEAVLDDPEVAAGSLRLGYGPGRSWGSEGPGWLDHEEGDMLAVLPGGPGEGGSPSTLSATISLAALGTMTSWTLYQQPEALVNPIPWLESDIPTPVDVHGTGITYDSYNMLVAYTPQFTYRMPRFRYWIPEEPNLDGELTGQRVDFSPPMGSS